MSDISPLVSCICAIDDDAWIDLSIAEFKSQSYGNKQLVLVRKSDKDHLQQLEDNIYLLSSNKSKTGSRKNAALDVSEGILFANWEQGCSFAPNRLTMQIVALAHEEAEISLLDSISYDVDGKKGILTNNRHAILESILLINHSKLRYRDIDEGCELYLLGDAVQINYKAVTLQGSDLYTRRY